MIPRILMTIAAAICFFVCGLFLLLSLVLSRSARASAGTAVDNFAYTILSIYYLFEDPDFDEPYNDWDEPATEVAPQVRTEQ